MKQRKDTLPPAKPIPASTTRQEIDVYLKHITQLVEKNPKKVAQIFRAWLDIPAKTQKNKRAA